MLGLGNALTTGSTHEQKYSLSLDGDSDYVRIEDNAAFRGHNDFSFTAWIKVDSKGDFERIIDYSSTTGNSDVKFRLLLDDSADQKIYVRLGLQSGSGYSITDPTALTTDTWTHYTFTFSKDGGLPRAKLYKNGNTTPVATTNADDSGLSNAANGPLLFGNQLSHSYYWDGNIDEVAIWNVAVDADAVAAVYNSGKPFNLNYDRGNYDNSSALVGYWRMFNGPFDDLQNGVVHDAHNPGFGSEALVNGDFATSGTPTAGSNSLGWTQGNADDDGSNITGGELILTHTASSDGNYTRVYATNGSAFLGPVNGATYKFTYTVSAVPTGSPTLSYYDGDSYNGMEETIGTHTTYFVHDSTAGSNRFIIKSSGNSTEIRLSYVSLVRLNGYPGLTTATATFSTDTPDD
jgi:hypothetical protein